jgi:mannose-1-phosphate guanylyltransferase
MAGGSGTRLWPLSRQSRPKQAIDLIGNRTMLQYAVDRLEGLLPLERVMVVMSREHVEILAEQVPGLPRDNVIIEPMPQGTAGAIGLAAVYLKRRDPDAVMAVLTADHYIRDVDRFRRALSAAAQVAREGRIVTLGIEPSFPSTGYGYIHRRQQVGQADGFDIYAVERFVEKPDARRAAEFLQTGLYSWNSGMFIWRLGRIMAEFARQMPDFHRQLQEVESALGTPRERDVLADVWPQVHRQTIDYGIMEGADDVVIIPVDIGWTDIGDWAAIYDLLEPDELGNVVVGAKHIGLDTGACFIRGGDRLIATVGLQDLIVVETGDAILICPRNRAQDVKSIVEELDKKGYAVYL